MQTDTWYRSEARFISDWRNVRSVDYSTNAVVSTWYSGVQTKYFRQNEIQGFADKLNKGDTITLGIDYYGLFDISRVWLDWLNPKIFYEVAREIYDEKVVVIIVWFDKKIKYKRI